MLDELDHRPVEQELAGLVVAAEPLVDLLAARCPADPEVAVARRPKCVAEPPLHVAQRPPAGQVAGREPADLLLALGVVVPELDARSRRRTARTARPSAGYHSKPAAGQVELLDHQRMEQPDQVGTGRDPVARPDLLERAGPPTRSRASSTSTRLPARAR